MSEAGKPSPSDIEEGLAAAEAFHKAAVPLATAPVFVNRFQFYEMPHGSIMVLGSAIGARQKDGSIRPFVRPVAAFMFDKEMAVNLMLGLQESFDIDEKDIAEGHQRMVKED